MTPFDLARHGPVAVATLIPKHPSDDEAVAIRDGLLPLVTSPDIAGLVIDFRRVRYFDANLRGVLIVLWKQLDPRGGRLAVCHLGDMATHPTIVQFGNSIMAVRDTLDEAVAAVTPDPPAAEFIDSVLVVRVPHPESVSWSSAERDYWEREVLARVDALPGRPWVVLDCSAWRFLGSERLGLASAARRRAWSRGGEALMCGLKPDLEHMLTQLLPRGLADVVHPRAATRAEAVARLAARRSEFPPE